MIDYKQPWHVLSIDTSNALNPDFDAEQFRLQSPYANESGGIWSFRGNDMLQFLNRDWLQMLNQLGLDVNSFLMFYREPYLIYPEAHIDLYRHNNLPNIFALNWVFSPDDDSFMTWYDVDISSGTMSKTLSDTRYCYWNLSEINDKEFARHTIGNTLTMVNTGIPHNIIVNTQPRWVISLRFKNDDAIQTWRDAVDYFDNLNLIKL